MEDYNKIAQHILEEKDGKIFIGREEIKPDLLDALSGQAKFLQTSQLYEILKATLINESADLALKQSQNWDNVLFAKALHHWVYVLDSVILTLTK